MRSFRTGVLGVVNFDRLVIGLCGIERLTIVVMIDENSCLIQEHLMQLCTYTIAKYSKIITYNGQDCVDI
jgi:hypothetical protein